ncbi:MAG: hypothetical protein QGG73_08385 [Candidatus Hydrogenedentes bacterium]|nr:hypothetical protein [Candidatus Hydrogenedentota bacterium]
MAEEAGNIPKERDAGFPIQFVAAQDGLKGCGRYFRPHFLPEPRFEVGMLAE